MDHTPRILYEDECLLAVEKPAGMPSQPDPSGQVSLLACLQERYPYVGLVHRLDTPTGGVMLFSADQAYTGKLSDALNDKENTQKVYLAVIPSPPPTSEGVWEDHLYHDKRMNKSFAVAKGKDGKARKGAKYAKLSYETLHSLADGTTLVRVRLYTGRTHQIRVQFASRGLPLLGDGKYGSRAKLPRGGFALWAERLSIPHPRTNHGLTFVSLPHTDMSPWQQFQDILSTSEGE